MILIYYQIGGYPPDHIVCYVLGRKTFEEPRPMYPGTSCACNMYVSPGMILENWTTPRLHARSKVLRRAILTVYYVNLTP